MGGKRVNGVSSAQVFSCATRKVVLTAFVDFTGTMLAHAS